MEHLQSWIDKKIGEIGRLLPELVYTNPSSFKCGLNMGYKQALLDIDRIIHDDDINYYHCGHCHEKVCFDMVCPACGNEDEKI